MIEAIHEGLRLGLIAGFAVLGCALTLVLLWGVIELINKVYSIWDHIRGDRHEWEERGKRGDDW